MTLARPSKRNTKPVKEWAVTFGPNAGVHAGTRTTAPLKSAVIPSVLFEISGQGGVPPVRVRPAVRTHVLISAEDFRLLRLNRTPQERQETAPDHKSCFSLHSI